MSDIAASQPLNDFCDYKDEINGSTAAAAAGSGARSGTDSDRVGSDEVLMYGLPHHQGE